MQSKNYIRINFRIPVTLEDSYAVKSSGLGITKSKLLRKWLHQASRSGAILTGTYPTKQHEQWSTYNLRFTIDEYSLLSAMAKSHKLKKGQLLRQLIQWGVDSIGIQSYSGNSPLLNLTFEDTLNQVDQSIDRGELLLAGQYLDQMESKMLSKYREHAMFGQVDLRRAVIARHQRRLRSATRLIKNSSDIFAANPVPQADRNYLLVQTSVLFELQDNIDGAIAAITDVNPVDRGDDKRRSIRLAALKSMNGESGFSHEDLDPDSYQSEIKFARAMNREGLILVRQGRFDKASDLFDRSSIICKSNGYMKEYRYTLENRALIKINQGDLATAAFMLAEAIKLDHQFRGRTDVYSKSQMLHKYCRAGLGSRSAIYELQDLVTLQHQPIYRSLGEYYYSSALVLFGETNAQVNSGRKRLLRLANSRGPGRISNLANSVVFESRFTPVL